MLVKVGEFAEFKLQLKDEYGFAYEPDSLILNIVSNDSTEYIVNPVREKLGVYTVSFEIPQNASQGPWEANWEGTVGDGVIQFKNSFVVYSGEKPEVNNFELQSNSIYKINIKNIKSIDGESISESFWFTSKYSPICGSVNKIIIKLQNVLKNIDIDAINFLLHIYTKDAYQLREIWKSQYPKECNLYSKYVCQYAETAAMIDLLNASIADGTQLRGKKLAELAVFYKDNENIFLSLLDDLKKEKDRLLPYVISGGCKAKLGIGISTLARSSGHIDYNRAGRQVNFPIGDSLITNVKAIMPPSLRSYYAFSPARYLPIGGRNVTVFEK